MLEEYKYEENVYNHEYDMIKDVYYIQVEL